MIVSRWLMGLLRHRGGRVAGAAVGVAIAVATVAFLGAFFSASQATMTDRAAASVAVDWQVQVTDRARAEQVLKTLSGTSGTATVDRVDYLTANGLTATTGSTRQTTGVAKILGVSASYPLDYPAQIRTLAGASSGVLLAQQTAANLHVQPGDQVRIMLKQTSVQLTVDGIVELPQADLLFQRVGAPSQSQPVAPPDNVVLVPTDTLTSLAAQAGPNAIATQFHVALDTNLPSDPAGAYQQVIGQANNFESAATGAAVVGNNIGAALDAAREDAAYSKVLFLFLGLPAAILAGLVTITVTSSGASRRRQDQALLRTRGATRRQILALAGYEAALVGIGGSILGLLGAVVIGATVFGSPTFGPTLVVASVWLGLSVLLGLTIAGLAVLAPVWRDVRDATVAQSQVEVGRRRMPRWSRWGIDVLLLAISLAIFWAAGRNKYALVLAPEGVPKLSVSYWAFAAPALLWIAVALLTWRTVDGVLRRGQPLISRVLGPINGDLSGPVAATMKRRSGVLARGVMVMALAIAFATSTATFNATYAQQAEVDAQLTNGADVAVTESPGANVGPSAGAALAGAHGVVKVEPMQHRFAYVGNDLQDLYGIDASTIRQTTTLQDAYFQGGTTQALLDTLQSTPNAVLVSAETVADFQLHQGDTIRLRLTDDQTHQLRAIPFTYVGVANEFPTAPKDSFLVANASYIADQTHSDAVGTFLVDTKTGMEKTVADQLQTTLGTSALVTDISQTRGLIGSSLTAVDLHGLTRVELVLAILLVFAATGLVLGLGVAERRRAFAITSAIGATRRQLVCMVASESIVVSVLGLAFGALASWGLSQMLVKVLSGVFDPPPASLSVPWLYIMIVAAVAASATLLSAFVADRGTRRIAVEDLRERR